MMPQCGLAPGFISIIGHARRESRSTNVEELRLRVGALTQFPTNGLKYNLTWSTAGLIHEYLQGCEAIVDGALTESSSRSRVLRPSPSTASIMKRSTRQADSARLCERLDAASATSTTRPMRYPGP